MECDTHGKYLGRAVSPSEAVTTPSTATRCCCRSAGISMAKVKRRDSIFHCANESSNDKHASPQHISPSADPVPEGPVSLKPAWFFF